SQDPMHSSPFRHKSARILGGTHQRRYRSCFPKTGLLALPDVKLRQIYNHWSNYAIESSLCVCFNTKSSDRSSPLLSPFSREDERSAAPHENNHWRRGVATA